MELIIRGKGHEAAHAHGQGEEDLTSGVGPYLWLERGETKLAIWGNFIEDILIDIENGNLLRETDACEVFE